MAHFNHKQAVKEFWRKSKGRIAVLSPFVEANGFIRPPPYLINGSSGPLESDPKRYIDRFNERDQQTDTQYRLRHAVCSNTFLSLLTLRSSLHNVPYHLECIACVRQSLKGAVTFWHVLFFETHCICSANKYVTAVSDSHSHSQELRTIRLRLQNCLF